MREVFHIFKDDEKAIISSLMSHPETKLSSNQIYNYARKYIKVNKENFYRKVQRMAEKEFLLHKKDIHGSYLYFLNPEIEFILDGPALELLDEFKEDATDDQLNHSFKLKEAIQNWMDNMEEPNPDSPECGKSIGAVISSCEAHLLFPDLANHLPELGINACEKWRDYREELLRLDEHKQHLRSSLRDEILKCFIGLNLRFVYNGEHHLEDYECYLNPLILYDIVLGLVSEDDGYHNYEMFLSWLECNAPIVENGDHVLWGETISYLRVPVKDRALMDAGVPRFLAFLRDIQHSEHVGIAADISKKVEELKTKRIAMLRDLERALLYSNFPGACQYLK